MYKTYSYKNMPMKRHYGSGSNDFTVEGGGRREVDRTQAPSSKAARDIRDKEGNNTECKNGFLSGLEGDDLLLIAVALVLLSDGCEDKTLLAALAFIFMTGR